MSYYSTLKAERLEARISPEQKILFQRAANFLGRSLTDFAVNTLQEAAIHIIKEHEILHLAFEDQEVFIHALLYPAKPSSRLSKAVRRYKKGIFRA